MTGSFLSLVLVLPSVLFATDFYVDQNNPNCGVGTGSQTAPFCTIGQALAVAANGDTIFVGPGTYLENLTWPNANVSLIGSAGALLTTVVKAGSSGSVVVVPSGATATIDRVWIRSGAAVFGGGVNNAGTLTLLNSTVSGNVCTGVFSGAGGGIGSTGELTLINTTVSGNTSNSYQGGGGIYATGGPVTLINSRIRDNWTNGVLGSFATYGGSGSGVQVRFGASLTITNCTVSGNVISTSGGGYGAGVFAYSTPLVVDSSTISGNSNGYVGGGIVAASCNPTTFRNSTITNNYGTGLVTSSSSPFPTTVLNCTIASNTGILYPGGWAHTSSGAAQVRNTIIASNFGSVPAQPNISGSFQSLGHNLIGNPTGGVGFTNGVLGDQVGVANPGLAPLANNGGPTQTRALLPGSPAINAGDPLVFELFDQRGAPRSAGSADIGAFESQSTATYCSAGTSSNGCVALISSSGTASASAASGFTISVASVPGQRQGLILYGVDNTGFTPTVWGSGSSLVCVKSPLQRTTAQLSGGSSNQCDGALSIDWNAFRATHPMALGTPFAAGDVVYAQGWYRDPPASKSTSLSNALQFFVAP
ncbi:MAG: right-handed parallel beta-helix repeat-containing protein [Planctomycetes bacterium]|nr:right-handed parallel beta-helix repeat-containing protein [Planctomycetota bacterium]